MKTSTIGWGLGALAVGTGIFFLGRKTTTQLPSVGGIPPKNHQDPVPVPAGPLRDLGPKAMRIAAFIESLDAEEKQALQEATPDTWWDWLTTASTARPDDMVAVALNPMVIDWVVMQEEAQTELKSKILWALGPLKAVELRSILNENGISA